MGLAIKIIRRSINALFHNYHAFAATAAILILPVSASVLLSQTLAPSSFPALRNLSSRLRLLLEAAGFPASSEFFTLLNVKIIQTIFSFIFTLPFTLTFLLLAKASIVHMVHYSPRRMITPPPLSSSLRVYFALLQTHVFNSFVILSANAAVLSVLFLAFNIMDALGVSSSNAIFVFSVAGVILYSVVLANVMVVCNLAMIVSAVENCSGYLPVLKACVLIRGRAATAMTLAMPANLSMAAIEALFQYRVMKPYHLSRRLDISTLGEAFSISYIYSMLIVLEVIISCMFYRSCKSEYDCQTELEPDEKGALQA
ncbi:hypothetical protein J5N97_010316 [Dioscorea zingiberensis]|uniref:Uncharacterized protein n=1 Tax=Dioscorea zingiberensis TaxID=325984 RepID=A0A9D5CYX3_9LILI|nr:hypothetical protein J5N97_010316 [Dioscorea zingiberensis]